MFKMKKIVAALCAAVTFATSAGITAMADTSENAAKIIGDISGNGKIDLYDAIAVAESMVGKRTFTAEEAKIADYNQDGKVDLYDAIGIAVHMLNPDMPVQTLPEDEPTDNSILKDIVDANDCYALVEEYGAIEYTNSYFFGNGNADIDHKYMDKDGAVSNSMLRTIFDNNGDVYTVYIGEEKPCHALFVENYYNDYFIRYYSNPVSISYDETETIIESEEKDGILKIVTTLSYKDFIKFYAEDFGYDPDEIVDAKYVYEVFADNYLLKSLTSYFIKNDGTEVKYSEMLRVEEPKKIVPDDDLVKIMEAEGTKTITVITDTGEEFTQTVCDDGIIEIYLPEDYEQKLYLDPEYTEIYKRDKDDEPELTLYARHEPEDEEENNRPISFAKGVLAGNDCYYIFDGNNSGRTLSYETGTGVAFEYESDSHEKAVFHMGDREHSIEVSVSQKNNDIIFEWEDGKTETLAFVSSITDENFKFYTNDELCEIALNYFEEQTGNRPTEAVVDTENSGHIATVILYDNLGDHNSVAARYAINRISLGGKDLDTEEALDFNEKEDEIPEGRPAAFTEGVWASDQGRYWIFEGEIRGYTLSYDERMGNIYEYKITSPGKAVFTDVNAEISKNMTYSKDSEKAVIEWENGVTEHLEYIGYYAPENFKFYTDSELCKLALDHYEMKNGTRPSLAAVDKENDGNVVTIQLYDNVDGHNSTSAWYKISRITLKGTNLSASEDIDLNDVK